MAFEIENGILKKYIKEKGVTEVIIPDSVTIIGKYAFYECSGLTSITIPDGVTVISNYAFYGCSGLTSIIIPDNVIKIGKYSFHRCKNLENIKIPDSVASIGNLAFGKTKWFRNYPHDMVIINNIFLRYKGSSTDVVVPESVTSINNMAFYKCENLVSITIPDSITYIGESTFKSCSNLRTIIIYKGDVKTAFAFKNKWSRNNQEKYLLNNFISADISRRQQYFDKMEFYYKTPLAIFMMSAYPQETYYHDYMKTHTEDAVRCLTDEEDIELLYRFLDFGFVTEDNIDSLISYAIEHTQNGRSSEPQLVLAKYRSDNFSSESSDSFDKFIL